MGEHRVEIEKVYERRVKDVTLDSVHRMGTKAAGQQRAIVAKFNSSKGKDEVLKHTRDHSGKHQYQIYEQLPAEVIEKKKRLMDKYKEARRNKENRVSWQLDKLVINGTVYHADDVKLEFHRENRTHRAASGRKT